MNCFVYRRRQLTDKFDCIVNGVVFYRGFFKGQDTNGSFPNKKMI